MKFFQKFRLSYFILSFLFTTATTAVALDTDDLVTVEKIRHCTPGILCNSVQSLPEYSYWENENVSRQHQKKTWISRYSTPSKNNTKYLVFVASGQERAFGLSGSLNGKSTNWKDEYTNQEWEEDFEINSSLITKVLGNYDEFKPSETYAAGAWDARFNWEFSQGEKNDILEAYYKWLSSKFHAHKIKVIYLAGHSRGGCLAMRLAQKFNNAHPNVPIIVHSFDGVCNQIQHELGTWGTKITNPTNSGYKAFKTNMINQFNNKKSIAIYHMASGDDVLEAAHAFTHSGFKVEHNGFDWYNQQWFDVQHTAMDSWLTHDEAQTHLNYFLDRFDCPGNEKWSGETCSVPQCPLSGSIYNGIHCYIPTPTGHTAFIWSNKGYWTPGPGNYCPAPSNYDGANCYLGPLPNVFKFNDMVHYTPTLSHTPIPTSVKGNLIRLKHNQTGKCLLASVDHVFNEYCSSDRTQFFIKEMMSGNEFRLKHYESGECVEVVGGNGANVALKNCNSSLKQRFVMDNANTGVRLRNLYNNQCLYSHSQHGGPTKSWGCWNDPNMEYILDYYWTEWLDRDNPSGSGDYETGHTGLPCTPSDVLTRVKSTSTIYEPGDNTPDYLHVFNSAGVACKNTNQSDGYCNDYEVKFLCD